jgi:hypothetical protein
MYNVINDPLSEKRVYNYIIIRNNSNVYIRVHVCVCTLNIMYYVRVKSVALVIQNNLLCIRGKKKTKIDIVTFQRCARSQTGTHDVYYNKNTTNISRFAGNETRCTIRYANLNPINRRSVIAPIL